MRIILQTVAVLIAGFLVTEGTFAHEGREMPTTLAGHLEFKQGELHIHATFPQPPVGGQEASMLLETRDAKTHQIIEIEDKVSVVLWMPSMGHGSTPTVVQRLDVGTYRASEVFFIMPGEWDLKFQLKTGSEVTDEALVQIVL